MSQTPAILAPSELPLQGRHLIEASAGTGKTFNITRLYLRFLIEKQLSVQQILVMTFTKAATQELKARIDKELRNALNNWGNLGQSDPFFASMEQKYPADRVKPILKLALLDLDEAAIFTIHGFCNRVLSQQAFASGIDFDTKMEADTSELLLTAAQDWLRKINQNEAEFALLQQNNWHTPEQFLKHFSNAIRQNEVLTAVDESKVAQGQQLALSTYAHACYVQKQAIKKDLCAEQDAVFEALVTHHKDKDLRLDEWFQLLNWLDSDSSELAPKAAGDFINGNRYRGNAFLKSLFEPFKQLREQVKKDISKLESKVQQQRESVPICQLVLQGIYQIKQAFIVAKQQNSLMDFDDLIVQLSELLQAEKQVANNPNETTHIAESASCANKAQLKPLTCALNTLFPVALVDEFQDTDAAQYQILDCLYPKSDIQHCLMMIGDPKQAIYGFRGGDIFTYLKARDAADFKWVMDTNWRSMAGVVTGYNRLFWGGPLNQNAQSVFGYGIDYENIHSTPKAAANKRPLTDENQSFGAINYVYLDSVAKPTGSKGNATKEDYCQSLSTWCANEIIRLLTQAKLGDALIKQQDIAVLVKTGREAEFIKQALANAGLSAVYLSDRANLFLSEQAKEIEYVLTALLEVENESLLIRALSTRLFGFNAEQLAKFQHAEYQDEWEAALNTAIELKQLWQYKGVMAMLMHLIHHYYQPLSHQHERELTNMIHLAELLQQATRQYKHPQQLVKWYRQQREYGHNEAEQRLESEANLIRIITQHSSKGLEYPVVFIPFASIYSDPSKIGSQTKQFFTYYDESLKKSVHQIGADQSVIAKVTEQGIAESIRLLYVAVTRAEHRCYLGIAPFEQSEYSALAKTLQLKNAQAWPDYLKALVETSHHSSQLIELSPEFETLQYTANDVPDENIQAQIFNTKINDNWSLYSFSKITRNAHASVSIKDYERQDEAAHLLAADTQATPNLPINDELNLTEQSTLNPDISPDAFRFTLAKGASTGNLLHDILEYTDFSEPDWQSSITEPVSRFGQLDDEQQNELIAWLNSVLHTQLPVIEPETQRFCLADLRREQTLREAEFYFPLSQSQTGLLMKVLKQHRKQNQAIYLPTASELDGMMHGFIDLIFEFNGRYYVADYKSTHLGYQVEDYNPEALTLNNQQHFYDLQYLIYCLALHRYLTKRLDDYQPELHFGGVYYLYLRGMAQSNNQPYGVYHSAISCELLTELEQVFSNDYLKNEQPQIAQLQDTRSGEAE
ncbi:exodeoxyribonuclease V subunit beta [Catenovulum adriaticum]|uniref:RecBCD enzyme subunit RecB n=1 Tax=Catenovulum adriaticum TaxID=2984846 RepID=A0ABY7AT41_9ALTE|nr:exodeoxyribonuclease V subunit beta [Catenovulum sp. TS8]WAJ71456.1 exodeoxyribonuclease V subunit beta [Catenovulum sp. TS8]